MDFPIKDGVLTIGVSPDVHAATPKFDSRKCYHQSLGYHDYEELCREAAKAKQKQTSCAICCLYKWPSELCEAGVWERDNPPKLKRIGKSRFVELSRDTANPFLPVKK